ncbi:hypothetical protein [Terriglobus sp. TAA 43]|uniref:hypothetical protein n=1 Tax=Terriglobus sp. TAA 43 TaxID=278961 RepID=UPI0012ED9708|nr:hypothetical protein [Terriglobus sp. TAA 43]
MSLNPMIDEPTPDLHGLRRRKMLAAVYIIGGVAELTAFSILAVLHLLPYFPAAFGIILGLHLLPLAGVFHSSHFRTFGWAIALWSAGCLLLTEHLVLMSSAGILVLATLLLLVLLFLGRAAAPANTAS